MLEFKLSAWYSERHTCPCGFLRYSAELGWHTFLHEGVQLWRGAAMCPRCRCSLYVTERGTPVVGWPGTNLEWAIDKETRHTILAESFLHFKGIEERRG